MIFAIVVCLLITLCYTTLILVYLKGWTQHPEYHAPVGFEPSTFISIIIPARNEEKTIGACIESILEQRYPLHLLEIIVVDDHSTDKTGDVVQDFEQEHIKLLHLADHITPKEGMVAFKKAAIALGIKHSKGDLIVTTDADCVAPNTWLLQIAATYEEQHPALIVAPVVFHNKKTVVGLFQLIDFMTMQGITCATHALKLGNMSNGANLAFTKEIFHQVNGYEGIDALASGDDYLLMMKIAQQPNAKIVYIKSKQAIIATAPQPDWASFLSQRIRWASKTGKYDDKKLTSILLLVYALNLMLLVLGLLGFFWHDLWLLALVCLVLKTTAEYIFLIPVSAFFRKMWVLMYFPILQPLHILYIVLAGYFGFIGKYQWKDRKVK